MRTVRGRKLLTHIWQNVTIVVPEEDDGVAHQTIEFISHRLEVQAIENLKNWYSADYRFIALCKKLQ